MPWWVTVGHTHKLQKWVIFSNLLLFMYILDEAHYWPEISCITYRTRVLACLKEWLQQEGAGVEQEIPSSLQLCFIFS